MRRHLLDAAPLTALRQGRPVAVALMQPWVRIREATTIIRASGEVVESLRPGHTDSG